MPNKIFKYTIVLIGVLLIATFIYRYCFKENMMVYVDVNDTEYPTAILLSKVDDDSDFTLPQLWKDTDSRAILLKDSTIECELVRIIQRPPHSSHFSFPQRGSGKLYTGDICWINLAQADGTERNINDLVTISKTVPHDKGEYCMFTKVNDGYYSVCVSVV